MPLHFPGQTAAHPQGGIGIRALDDDGKNVPVRASNEAMTDFGLEAVLRVAEEKFDNGLFDAEGGIYVCTEDFK